MARNKNVRRSVNTLRTPRKVSGRNSRLTKPKLREGGPISERKRKLRGKVKEHRRMKLLRERMRLDKRIQANTQSSPVRKVILYPPIPPPPAPAMASSSTSSSALGPSRLRPSSRKHRNGKRPVNSANSDTIVIDSEDDVAIFQQQHPLFYVDITGGFNHKEVPRYVKGAVADTRKPEEPSVVVVEESILEDGEIRDGGEGCSTSQMQEKSDILNKNVNSEEIPISEDDDEDEDEVIDCERSTTVPMPKQMEDQSVIFCSEVIDLDSVESRKQNEPLDFIPIWFDLAGVGSRANSKRSPRKKIFQDMDKNGRQQKDKSKHPGESSGMKKRFVVIDGNNVAFAHTHGQAFSVKGLDICIQYFKKMGHEVKAVVPQFRLKKEKSTDQKLLEELYKKGDILLAPSKNLPGQKSSSYDDRLIISVAEKFDGVVISNDNFRDLLAENDSWKKIIETRVAGYTWAMDAFFLPDDPYGRKGPSLTEMLQMKPEADSEKTAKEK